jgi:XisH protein
MLLLKKPWSKMAGRLQISLKWSRSNMFVDLGAERLIGATKGTKKIAVEIKSFIGESEVNDLENALGQYLLYRSVMKKSKPERTLYLAVSEEAWANVLTDDLGSLVQQDYGVKIIIFSPEMKEVTQWVE